MSEPQTFQTIAENLGFLDDWEDRYRYLIELGQALPPLSEAEKNADTKVHGCASQVWLVSEPTIVDGKPGLLYRGESDALIVKGLVAIVLALYSGRPVAEIAATDAMEIFNKLDLREHLSTQRSNGLAAMVTRIRSDAKALV